MIIIELTYKKSLDEVNHFLQAHRDFLERCYSQKMFIASGPKNPRNGGVILAMGDLTEIKKIIEEDPFNQHGVADYRIIEFKPNKYDANFSDSFLEKN